MSDGTALREIAAEILTEVLERGQPIHTVLFAALSKYQYLEKADRSFLRRVAEGTTERLISIDYVLDSVSRTKVARMKPYIRTVLRMSAYQILYLDRVPDSAACNEAVKLVKKRGFAGLSGFVNGVLRTVSRKKEHIAYPDTATACSMPAWLAERLEGWYQKETAKAMMRAFLEERPLTVRFKESGESEAAILASLQAQGVSARRIFEGINAWELTGVDYPEALAAFQKGQIQFQDASSILCGEAVPLKEGDLVLDVCAAPGGKGLHCADRLRGSGQIIMRDISGHKCAQIEENIRRSRLANVRAALWDARKPDPALEGKADVVLADLPCSGLGIIGRKPDIKYRATPEGLANLEALQREILSVVWRYVKPGGCLVYSTCTVNRRENEENRAWFLREFPFEPVDLSGRFGPSFGEESLREGFIQLLPGIHPCDGFFIAVMRRKREE